MFMGFLREPSHLLVIGILVIVLFGYRRLPDAARGIGRSVRIFKSEMKQMAHDDKDDERKPAEPTEPLEGRVVRPQPVRTQADEPVRETPRNPSHPPG
jgi:sec-independent protein translocase protein TatA